MLAMIAGHSSPFRRPSLAAFRPSFKSFSPDATKAQASGFPARWHCFIFFRARGNPWHRQTSRAREGGPALWAANPKLGFFPAIHAGTSGRVIEL